MDSHLLIKIIHMSFASLAMLVFVVSALLLFKTNLPPAQQQGKSRVVLVALQHLSYSVLIIAGIVLLIQNQFAVQTWFYAKVILFLVAVSASNKAFGKRDISMSQRKAGVMVALVAYLSVIGLIMWKPNFSADNVVQHTSMSDQSIALQFAASLTHHSCFKKLV
jgi:uncharacterized membrane protein SirB2